jgi:hypothetical protein
MVTIPPKVIHFVAREIIAQPEEVGFFQRKNILRIKGISTAKRRVIA